MRTGPSSSAEARDRCSRWPRVVASPYRSPKPKRWSKQMSFRRSCQTVGTSCSTKVRLVMRRSRVFVMTLDANDSRHLVDADSGAIHDAVARKLLFVRQGTLLAQSFDPDLLKLSGEPAPVAERIESALVPGLVAFSLAANGTLVYGVGARDAAGLQMTWVDRQGKAIGTIAPVANYRGLDLSPDGKRAGRPSARGQWRRHLVDGHGPRRHLSLHLRRITGELVAAVVSGREPHRFFVTACRQMGHLHQTGESNRR